MSKCNPPTCSNLNSIERELYRYFQPNAVSGSECSKLESDSRPRRSACDPCLTSFAQLSALRMNAKRGIISLASPKVEYILAEAGRTLSLQQEDDNKDKLWHGVGKLEDNEGMGTDAMLQFADPKTAPSHIVINDASKDPRYKDKGVVTGYQSVRFLVCVPLRTPHKSTAIGMVIVVDDKPRDGVTEDELQYLLDLASTVMEYLEAGRTKQKQHRAESMVKALGLFVEGKSSLRDWWLNGGHNIQQSRLKKGTKHGVTLENRADFEFGVQEAADTGSVQGIDELERKPRRNGLASDGTVPSTDPRSEKDLTSFASISESGANTTVESEARGGDSPNESSHEEPSKLQEALVSSDVKSVFSRASNLIREATAVDGCVFFDASIGSFGGRSRRGVGAALERAPGEFHTNGNSESVTESSDEDRRYAGMDSSQRDLPGKTCNILGYSTRTRSSVKSHYPSETLRSFPENIMRRLLKRYPHGKVFNFDEDGAFWSSDSDGGNSTGPEAQSTLSSNLKTSRAKRRMPKEEEAATLLAAVPGARSIVWFPLWDQSKERWFSGALVWSASPIRVLCPTEDLTYMAAFGNSVMAEVSRLAAQIAAQMKSDFISSISHELRSPLHGVLASVEFLQQTELTEMQSDMVNNINASGKVLLDTINHVLDFSKVNRKTKQKSKRFRKSRARRSKAASPEITDTDATAEDLENICVLSEEVVNSVYAGRNMGRLAREISAGRNPGSEFIRTTNPVTVIVDIADRSNWSFGVDAGAWRRILMNLFSNALKYTDNGFVKVQIRVEKDESPLPGRKPRSNILLKISDSGKGISKEFLRHQLYKPFAQEDSLAVGTGLGVSIVKQIVQSMGGDIHVASEVGVGTEVKCRLPMTASTKASMDEHQTIVEEVRQKAEGLKVSFTGFDRYPEISETPTGILSADSQALLFLKSSMKTTLEEWFGIKEIQNTPGDTSTADLRVFLEDGFDAEVLTERIKQFRSSRTGYHVGNSSVALVLCSDLQYSRPDLDCAGFKVLYLHQPYGPLKLAKALRSGFVKTHLTEPFSKLSSPLNPAANSENIHVPLRTMHSTPSLDALTSPDSSSNPVSPLPLPLKENPHQESTPTGPGKAKESKTDPVPYITDGLKVLLVEDNEINMKLLVTYMRKLKVEYGTAMNGLEALNAYKEAKGGFDIIFMDISMPVMSGIESTRHIRSHEEEEGFEPVTLIALSGAANPAARQEAYACGINLFLTKPVPMKSLKTLLEDFKTKGIDNMDV